MGIKAAGNWYMHPDLREEQWYQEEREIKKWTGLGEQQRCCHGQVLRGCRATESWAVGYISVLHHLEDVNKHTPSLMLIITLSDSAMYIHVRLRGKKKTKTKPPKPRNLTNASKEDWNEWKTSEAVQVQSLVNQPIHFSLACESGWTQTTKKRGNKGGVDIEKDLFETWH